MRYAVLGVIILASLAGCGGSDSEDGESLPAQPASDAFVRQVDALCKDTNPELAAITTALAQARDERRAGRVSEAKTFEAFATLLRRARATTDRFVARLRAVDVPSRERAFYDALMASVEDGSSNLRQQLSVAQAQDAIRLRDLSIKGSVINAGSKGLITGHGGFRFCGRG